MRRSVELLSDRLRRRVLGTGMLRVRWWGLQEVAGLVLYRSRRA
jgi:hypothetical protein